MTKKMIACFLMITIVSCMTACGIGEKKADPATDIEEMIGGLETEEITNDLEIVETTGNFETKATVCCEGLYCQMDCRNDEGTSYNKCLRFYDDGGVISVSFAGNGDGNSFPKASWFNRESEHYAPLVGHYEIHGDEIEFQTVSENGTVDYWGKVFEGYMILDSHSNINDFEAFDREYVFYPFDEIPGWD